MTSEDPRSEAPVEEQASGETGEETHPAGQAPPAQPAVLTPLDDPLVAQAEPQRSLISKLNPLRWFRRQTPEFYVREGRELLDNQAYAQATVAFQNALSLDGNCVAAYRGLGKVFFKKGGRSNLETALKHYNEAILHSPKDHDLYAITAKIYDALGKRKEATIERKKFVIVRALEGDPGNAIANNNMGILYLQQGRADVAITYFRRALETNRNFDVAHRNLAATYYQHAHKEQDAEKRADLLARAKAEVQRALEIQENVPSLLAFARILMMEGKPEPALEAVNKADEINPANKDVYLLKKLALERLGRFEEARNAFESYQVFAHAEGAPPPE